MNQPYRNIRKAAVLIRSLDADTAATLLAQLSPEEARQVRAAMKSVTSPEAEEQADIAAELRRAGPLATQRSDEGVALELRSRSVYSSGERTAPATAAEKRFDFLDHADTSHLVPLLAGEHAQTVAVVLSYLEPRRAADVLAALPGRLQADALQRLADLGDTDRESLHVLESELAAWVERRQIAVPQASRADAVAAILAAADGAARSVMLANLKRHHRHLADKLAPIESPPDKPSSPTAQPAAAPLKRRPTVTPAPPPPPPSIEFCDLIRLDSATLAAVLGKVDANLLVLALTGSSDDLVERVASQMPRRAAGAFRRRLQSIGPTRLSDVDDAQRIVARLAGLRLQQLKTGK